MKEIEAFFAPWNSLYSDSTPVSTTVIALHLLAMFIGGGLAIAADRATLRITHEKPGERERHLGEINAIHRPVLIALGVLFVTGVAMLTSDLKTFVPSPFLYVKLGLVALLVLNGVVLERTERGLRRTGVQAAQGSPPPLWRRFRLAAICSIGLWIATLVAGTVLANAA